MTLYTFLHTPDTFASDASAATSHQITMSFAIRAQGGAIGPSAIQFAIVFDSSSVTGSSVTDSAGNTYTLQSRDANVANGFTLEVWEAHDVVPDVVPTITWNGSGSVKAKLIAAEVDQIAPVNPHDGTATVVQQVTHRVDVTNSTSRSSAASNSTKSSGSLGVYIGFIGWNDTRTISAAGAGYTGMAQLNGGSTNLGIGIDRRSAEIKNIVGTNAIGRFTMSGAASTQPAAVVGVVYFRDGVVTDNNQAGYIDDIEGAVTVNTGISPDFVYRSSASAPLGGTGASEYSQEFTWQRKFYKKTGVTVADAFERRFTVSDGFDDGATLFHFYWTSFNSNQVGQTLDAGDENAGGGTATQITVDPNTPTEYGYNPTFSTDIDSGQDTSAFKITEEGDGSGFQTSNYINVINYNGNLPQYAILTLDYPVLATDTPQMNMSGVGT